MHLFDVPNDVRPTPRAPLDRPDLVGSVSVHEHLLREHEVELHSKTRKMLRSIGATRNAFALREMYCIAAEKLDGPQIGIEEGVLTLRTPSDVPVSDLQELLHQHINRVLAQLRERHHPRAGEMLSLDSAHLDFAYDLAMKDGNWNLAAQIAAWEEERDETLS